MSGRDPIPDTMKWQVASHLVSALPVMYEITFRDLVGENYERLEQQIWVNLAREARSVADSFRLPTGNAEELMSTLQLIQLVFFGPEMRTEEVPITVDRAVLVIRRCPFAVREMEMRAAGNEHLLSRCLAFSIAAIEELNPAFTMRYVRSMCTGDRTCELRILKKEELEKEERKNG